MSHLLELTFLGGYAVTLDGQPVSRFYSAKVQALLALLAVEADRTFSRAHLAGLFWPDSPEQLALQNLRQALAQLRRLLRDEERPTPFLRVTRQNVEWNAAADYRLDVDDFLRLLAQGTHAEAARRYSGEFLGGFFVPDAASFEEWVVVTREQLHRAAVDALESLISAAESAPDLAAAQAYLHRLLLLDPWREEAHCRLMAVYARSGQTSAALLQFEKCRRVLEEELGVPPTAETLALYEQIRRRVYPTRPEAQRDAAPAALPHNLPEHRTQLVGRDAEVGAVCARLADPHCRLLTVTGLGGVGKTRLALAAAQRQAAASLYPGGLFWVSLAGVESGYDPDETEQRILLSIAAVLPLALHREETPFAQLLHWLSNQKVLLILDNCENLLSGMAVVGRLLEQATALCILATARAAQSARRVALSAGRTRCACSL